MISRFRVLTAVLAAALLSLGLSSIASAAGPAWQPVGVTGPTNLPPVQSEVQSVFVDAEGGAYTLTFSGQTTAPIPFDAAPATVEAALNALSTIGGAGGSVSVVGGPGAPGGKTPYAVTFGGSMVNIDVAALSADGAGLSGEASSVTPATTVPGGQGTTTLGLYAQNIGGFESSGKVTYKAMLPPGVTTTQTPSGQEGGFFGTKWACTEGSGQTEFTCTFEKEGEPTKVPPTYLLPVIKAPITAAPGADSGTVEIEISGGGGLPVAAEAPLTISSLPAAPGIQTFVAGAYDSNGQNDVQAGGHPYSAGTAIFATTRRSVKGDVVLAGEYRDIVVDLPPGFLGNPIAVPECPESTQDTFCPLNTMVGVVHPVLTFAENLTPFPVFNTEAPLGSPAKYRFNVFGTVPLNAVGTLRSEEDYGITVASRNTPQIVPLFGAFFTFWGAPADPSHDSTRCPGVVVTSGGGATGPCEASDVANTAFTTSASNCAEQATTTPVTFLKVSTWQFPGELLRSSVEIPPVTGCEDLEFSSEFTFEPSDTKSDSPASFRTSLTQPADGLTDSTKLANPPLKDAVVDLPQGVTLNPSGADGLGACSLEQIGFRGASFAMPNPMRFSREPHRCPDAAKIGSGVLKTELLTEPLKGDLYLAEQGSGNPFGSLFALYLVIEDPRHGIFIKLPGRVDADSQTGEFTTTFQNLPQIPFTRLDLTLKGGNRSALASPMTCGNYVTRAISTPWSAPESGPPHESANGFQINQGPNGMPCAPTPADRPFDVKLNAGTDSITAGAFSPLTFQFTRPDGSQEISDLELTTAPGLAASLAGIAKCSDEAISRAGSSTGKEEQSNPACPGSSKIGRLETGAGAGPTPFYASGSLYLAGPYKGAPLSVVAITPAVAGPFDLGNVVVRTAVFLNRSTAQVNAKADPIPQILEGVPLRIKDVRVILDRPGFSLNPTSCEANQITAKLNGNSGAVANLSSRFQVAGCGDLAFKPKLSAKLIGGTKRGDHPAFVAEVKWPAGAYANTKNVAVTLPRSEFLDQANIRTICTRVQAAADTCPKGAIYGEAEATTPLLDEPLKGPVFLKSSDNKLPDLAIKLRGPASMPVEVEFQGRIDSIKGQIRDTIEGLPDVPVTKFVLRMRGGRKGLLVNSRNLCKGKPGRMNVRMLGHNNKRGDQKPRLKNSCKKAKKRKGQKKRSKKR